MRFELVRPPTASRPSGVCRIIAEGIRWRVLVDAWPADGEWRGRLVFEPDEADAAHETRAGPAALRGPSRESVVAQAHELPESRLRTLLHAML